MFNKIKEELRKTLASLTNSEQMAAPTTDEINVSDMVVGGKVEIVNPDGSLSDAPDGEYDYNGHKLEVKDSLIVSIDGDKGEQKPAEDMANESPVQDAPAKDSNDMQAQIDELKSAIEEIKKQLADGQAANQKMAAESEKFSEAINSLNETIKAILVTPAEFSKTNTSIKVKDEKEAKINAFTKVLAESMKK
ncbi:MAG: hypothetical protein QM737_22620 [Ferruginibacter sp.]